MGFDAITHMRCELNNIREYVPNKPPEAKLKESGITRMIDLATNESPYGIPQKSYEAILEIASASLNHYPESGCYDLVSRLAQYYQLKPENFLIDNGLDGVLTTIGLTFFSPGDEIITAASTFPTYDLTARLMGSQSVLVPLTADYHLDLGRMTQMCSQKTKAIFICNPNNPTGDIITQAELEAFLGLIPQRILVVVDEAFGEFATDPDYPQAISMLADHPNLMVLRTFSKAWGLAGLRVGYAVASPEIIQVMYRARESFPVNALAQVAAIAALDDPQKLTDTVNKVCKNREAMYTNFSQLGLFSLRSQANFLFVDAGRNAAEIWDRLYASGIVVRKLHEFKYPNCFRICAGAPRDLDHLYDSLQNIMQEIRL